MSEKTKKILTVTSVCFITLFLLAILNRSGSLVLLWKEEPLGSITHDAGHGYYAFVRDENIAKLRLPFFLKEDDVYPDPGPLSVNEDITLSIKEQGGGAYQILQNNDLYFSASDNRPEEHEYSVVSPLIIRNRWLLVLFAFAALSAAALFLSWLKTKDLSPFKTTLRILMAVLFLLLLLPWNRMTFPSAPLDAGPFLIKPLLQRNALFTGLLFLITLLFSLYAEKNRFRLCLAVLIILSNTVYYFIPEWNYYGQRADSASYLRQYSASSIRTPGYPLFIETVYRLSGKDGLQDLRAEENLPDETLRSGQTSDSRGLLEVVRWQKCILGAAFLILFWVYCRFYPAHWFVFAAQIILCGSFLGADNSYLMTECLSQALTLLAAAMFLLVWKTQKAAPFLCQCLFSAAAILVRPANIFLAVPVLICALRLLTARRGLWPALAGCFMFLILSAIPALTIYRHYGIFLWMPVSGYAEIGRAVEIMQPGDEDAFSDPESREFCLALLTEKQDHPGADQNTYVWQIAVPAAESLGYDRITCSPLFAKVSRRIFSLHFADFLASLGKTMKTALERTRLQIGRIPFPALAALFTVLFLLRISSDGTAGMILMLEHMVHLCISVVNQPERRYIYSTEILCLLGWLLIIVSLSEKKNREQLHAKR